MAEILTIIAATLFVLAIIQNLLGKLGETSMFGNYKWVVPKGGIFIPLYCSRLQDLLRTDLHFVDENWFRWATLTRHGLHVNEGYSWDGCSPKIKVWKFLLGTWDGHRTTQKVKIGGFEETIYQQQMYIPSLIHDVLCQFRHQSPFNQEWADEKFRMAANAESFKFAKLYYNIVRFYQEIKGNY